MVGDWIDRLLEDLGIVAADGENDRLAAVDTELDALVPDKRRASVETCAESAA